MQQRTRFLSLSLSHHDTEQNKNTHTSFAFLVFASLSFRLIWTNEEKVVRQCSRKISAVRSGASKVRIQQRTRVIASSVRGTVGVAGGGGGTEGDDEEDEDDDEEEEEEGEEAGRGAAGRRVRPC